MKTHTSAFKNAIKEYGRELDTLITYELNEETIELGVEELNSVVPSFEGSILKSVMKQLILDSNVEIPIGTDLHLQFGVKVRDNTVQNYRDNYDYVNFGHYLVKEVIKKEDTNSYEIKCYDKLLYAMQDYEMLDITYPVTIRSYINAIANKLGLVFKNASDTFANYDKEVSQELFFSKDTQIVEEEGQEPTETTVYTSLGFTYRDILDQLAQVTASTICINEADDELEIRYINNTNDTIDEEYLKENNINFGEKYGVVNSIVLSRSGESDNVYLQDEESIEDNGLCEIKIVDNLFMNFDDRNTYLTDILEQLGGLEYYTNDFSSTGVVYYNLCDRYSVTRDNTTYSCVMFNDEVLITQGLEENIHTNMPENSETDYDKADKIDQKINKAMIVVNKQENTINSLVQTVQNQGDNISTLTNKVQETITSTEDRIEVIESTIVNGVENLRNNLVTIDINGIHVATNQSEIETLMTNDNFVIKSGDTTLAYFGYDSDSSSTKAEMDNLTVTNYFITGYHRIEKFDIDGEEHTGIFYIGGGY